MQIYNHAHKQNVRLSLWLVGTNIIEGGQQHPNFNVQCVRVFVQHIIAYQKPTISMNISEYGEEENMPNYKVIIVGKTMSGKTKLLARYKFGTYNDDGTITVGVDSLIIKTSQANFSYYDTAGQDRYEAIVSSYFRGSDACILTYDVSSIKSFEKMATYYNNVKENIPNCLIYIVGCKSDLQRQVSDEMAYKYYKGYRHELTSAKTNHNVQEMFKSLEEELLKSHKKEKQVPHKNSKSVLDCRKKPAKKCCE